MSEEQKGLWKKVEEKGLEKLGNMMKALEENQNLEEANNEYYDFIVKLANATGLRASELDIHFVMLWSEHEEK